MPKENSKGDFKSPLFNFSKSTFQFYLTGKNKEIVKIFGLFFFPTEI